MTKPFEKWVPDGMQGCGDSSCMLVTQGGMVTNGGCRCRPHQYQLVMMSMKREIERLTAENSGQWVSVTDRLPDQGVVVLAYEPAWYDIPFPMMLNQLGEWVWWWNKQRAGVVTHWMPLPAIPDSSQQEPAP